MPQDRLFDIWFALRVGIASREFSAVLDSYESTYQLFNADAAELEQLPCGERLRTALGDKSLDEAYRIKSYCEKAGVRLLFWRDAEYPASLRTLLDPPVLLYCLGRLPDFSRCLCISIVGTRTMSEYGKRMAYKIGYELAAAGTVPVSGMALGCDGVATAGALAAGGHPVAVLGSGIDIVYPSGHLTLYRELTAHGTVMTEYPPGTPPEGRNFPVRNRIISGLSVATVVVEAPLKSGALITAANAVEQGREVFAVPGPIDAPNSAGCHQLLREGAGLATCGWDILSEYEHRFPHKLHAAVPNLPPLPKDAGAPKTAEKEQEVKTSRPETVQAPALPCITAAEWDTLSPEQQTVLKALRSDMPQLTDQLAEQTGLPIQRVLPAITLLEISGWAVQNGARSFVRTVALPEQE